MRLVTSKVAAPADLDLDPVPLPGIGAKHGTAVCIQFCKRNSKDPAKWKIAMVQQRHRAKNLWQATGRGLCPVLAGAMMLLLGCASGTTRKTASVSSSKTVEISAAEFSSRNQSLLGLYSGEIEAAADKIISESPSPAARRQALLWKADAIPVMQTSLLNTDPVAAVFDTWIFLFQMMAYMNRPALQQGFGDSHTVVAATLKNMDAEMDHLVLVAAPSANVADLRQRAQTWAENNPIQSSLSGRQSVDPEMVRRVGQIDFGPMASLARLGESLGDLAARLNSYNAYVPKQTRWQAELLLSDLTLDPRVDALMSNWMVVSQTLAKSSDNMQHIPELMGEARHAVVADVEGQRLATQAFLREERLQTLDAIQQERIATLAALRGERLAATADLRVERQIVLDSLHIDQVEVMNNVNATIDKAIRDLDTTGRSLIDHFFIRALQLLLLVIVVCTLVAWILLRRFTGRRRDRGEDLYDRAA